ncbi:peptidase domain-containing ABC transporter [Aeromonas veronii]
MKTILQDEMSECGLACIAMISSWYSIDTNLHELRRHYKTGREGLSFENMELILGDLGLATTCYELEWDDLKNLCMPSIIQWSYNHYVVITKVTFNSITIYDPAYGRRTYNKEMAKSLFSGYAINVHAPLIKGNTGDTVKKSASSKKNKLISSILCISSIKRYLFIFFIYSCLLQILSLMTPRYISLIVDKVTPSRDLDLLYVISTGFIVIYLIDFLIQLSSNFIKSTIIFNISSELSTFAYKKLVSLPAEYFSSRSSSEIIKRQSILSEYGSYFIDSYVNGLLGFVFSIVFLSVIFFVDSTSGFIALITSLIFIGVRLLFVKKIENHQSEHNHLESSRNELLKQLHQDIKSIKVNRYENTSIRGIIKLNDKRIKSFNLLSIFNDNGKSLYLFFSNICTVLIISFFVSSSFKHVTAYSYGNIFLLFFYKEFFFRNIAGFVEAAVGLIKYREQMNLSSAIFSADEEILTHSSLVKPLDSQPIDSLQIKNGSLSFSTFGRPAFKNLSLYVSKGQKIAITGKSGVGKSSLISVIASIQNLTTGHFYINGHSVDKFGIIDYRNSIGVFFADDIVRNSTILDNITQTEDYNKQLLCEVLIKTGLINEVNQFPSGINTLCGQGGVYLSSGQKQRLLIARALYKQPNVLILDEPSSHLDSLNKKYVFDIIRDFCGICIVVTHDQELLPVFDQVYKMEELC